MQDKVWITRDGRGILIRRMARSHILNCIDKIERSGGRWRRAYLERLRLELMIRDHLGESH